MICIWFSPWFYTGLHLTNACMILQIKFCHFITLTGRQSLICHSHSQGRSLSMPNVVDNRKIIIHLLNLSQSGEKKPYWDIGLFLTFVRYMFMNAQTDRIQYWWHTVKLLSTTIIIRIDVIFWECNLSTR